MGLHSANVNTFRHRTMISIALAISTFAGAPAKLPSKAHAGEIAMAAIQAREFFSSRTYGKPSPQVVNLNETVPRGGGYRVIGRVGVKDRSPRTYETGFTQIGVASWYGDAFHGRKTANGEIYDTTAFTAAHPGLPLPSYVRVTNLTNGRSLIVRVNDRGPYVGERVLDLSKASAEALGILRKGVADVMVTYIGVARMDGRDDMLLAESLRTDGNPAQMPQENSTPGWIGVAQLWDIALTYSSRWLQDTVVTLRAVDEFYDAA